MIGGQLPWAVATRAEGRLAAGRIARRPSEDHPPARTRLCTWNAPVGLPAPPALLRPGERLAGTPYVVMRLLGQGGMGEVYEVEHAELGRRAALKVLHRNHQDRPDLAARLRGEARLLARLRHPNLVEVFDLGVTADGRPYFAMPLLRGRDLRDALAGGGAFQAATAIALIAQALDGLAVAHAAGLVHRDVKLENLFLEEDGTLKVLDFGVAKVVSAGGRTEPGAAPGTPRTMAPEQCAGEPVDARADLYAVGLALYELCTGRGPFDDVRGNDHAIRFAHCDRAPLPPSRLAPRAVGAGLDAVILRALAKTPADRFQSAAEMAAALRALLPSARPIEPPASRPPISRPRPGRRRLRRPRSPWVPAIVSALAVTSFAAGLAFGRTLPLLGAPDRGSATSPATKL